MSFANELEKAYRYCESVTRLHAKSFYFAAKFLPKHKQKAVYPIYAFCRHVDDEIDEAEISGEEAIEAVEKWNLDWKKFILTRKREGRKTRRKSKLVKIISRK